MQRGRQQVLLFAVALNKIRHRKPPWNSMPGFYQIVTSLQRICATGYLDAAKAEIMLLVRKATTVVSKALDSDNEALRVRASLRILEGAGAFLGSLEYRETMLTCLESERATDDLFGS